MYHHLPNTFPPTVEEEDQKGQTDREPFRWHRRGKDRPIGGIVTGLRGLALRPEGPYRSDAVHLRPFVDGASGMDRYDHPLLRVSGIGGGWWDPFARAVRGRRQCPCAVSPCVFRADRRDGPDAGGKLYVCDMSLALHLSVFQFNIRFSSRFPFEYRVVHLRGTFCDLPQYRKHG